MKFENTISVYPLFISSSNVVLFKGVTSTEFDGFGFGVVRFAYSYSLSEMAGADTEK